MTEPSRAAAHEQRNREFWDADADDYQAVHAALLARAPMAWGVWRIPESEIGVLGDTAGLDVLEYGCGAAQWSIALARRGAAMVGLDQSRAQLSHARMLATDADARVPLVCASAERVPFAANSFDVVFCDHGAMSFCDPRVTVSEVARLVRPGGRFVFAHSTPWGYLTWSERRERVTRRLREPYFGIGMIDTGEGTVDFQLTYGDWIRLFRQYGFVIDDLVELRAPKGATTTYGWDAKWARRWPAEQIWKLHLAESRR